MVLRTFDAPAERDARAVRWEWVSGWRSTLIKAKEGMGGWREVTGKGDLI